MSKLQDALLEQYNRLEEYNLLGDSDYISARTDGGMLIVGPSREVKFVAYGKGEGEDALHLAIYADTDAAAIVHAHPGYVSAVSKAGATIPAVLDDMAQIVGPTCRTVAADNRKVVKELKGRNSCLIKGDGAVTTGRTLDEAFTCMLVLQKASICYVGGSVLGGCTVMMFGSSMYEGMKMLKECEFDDRTMILVSLAFCIGVGLTQTDGNFFAAFPQAVGDIFNGNAVAGVFVVSLLLSFVLPKEKKETEN